LRKLLITIDGPDGAGKTTASKALADRLGYTYVDTGALYRGVAYSARLEGILTEADAPLADLCRRLSFKFVHSPRGQRLFLGDADITEAIRSPEISLLASAVSARPVVRERLLAIQREMGAAKGVVFEGRDMGTVVFPEADVKFFLYASLNIRALRRYQEIEGNVDQSLADVTRDIEMRDNRDMNRAIAPLRPADSAIMLDSSLMTIAEVVNTMVQGVQAVMDGRQR